jgi:hypothetical protein
VFLQIARFQPFCFWAGLKGHLLHYHGTILAFRSLQHLELAPTNFHLYLTHRRSTQDADSSDWLWQFVVDVGATPPPLKTLVIRLHAATVNDATRIKWRRLDAACTGDVFPNLESVTFRIVVFSHDLRENVLRGTPHLEHDSLPGTSHLYYPVCELITAAMPYATLDGLLRFECIDTDSRSLDPVQHVSYVAPKSGADYIRCNTLHPVNLAIDEFSTPFDDHRGRPLCLGLALLTGAYRASMQPCMIVPHLNYKVCFPYCSKYMYGSNEIGEFVFSRLGHS